jgi:hypothetical protein
LFSGFLLPLFKSDKKEGVGWSFYGSIVILKNYVESGLYDDVQKYIWSKLLPRLRPNYSSDLYIRKIKPLEALLV